MSKRTKLKESFVHKKDVVKDDFDDFLKKQNQTEKPINKVNITRPEKVVKLKINKTSNHKLDDDFDLFLLKMERKN
jgi:hypothetical protein